MQAKAMRISAVEMYKLEGAKNDVGVGKMMPNVKETESNECDDPEAVTGESVRMSIESGVELVNQRSNAVFERDG
jgi:hypothetical protein